MVVEEQVSVINGITTNTDAGDVLRRSTQNLGSAVTTVVWDGSDSLQERT